MRARSHDASADAVGLGALLVLLHGADAPVDPVEVTYRVWRHRPRAHAAFVADVEEQKRRGASITSYGPSAAQPEPAEYEETVRIWRAGDRVRVEHHGGDRDGYYAVTDGALWWMWDERMGARSNEDDPSVGGSFADELEIMLSPIPLLSSLRFDPRGNSKVAGRPTTTALGTPRPQDPRHLGARELHELGTGAEYYELEVDQQLGVLLAVTAIRDGQPFHRITTLAIRFGQPIPDETFRFEPPAGEEIAPIHSEHRVEHVTLTEAQQETPFTVLMPDTVPANWQVQCRLIRPSQRPPSPMQIGLIYNSVDGHESVSLTQTAADARNPYKQIGDGEDWEKVTRGVIPDEDPAGPVGPGAGGTRARGHVRAPDVGQPHPRPAPEDRGQPTSSAQHEQHLMLRPADVSSVAGPRSVVCRQIARTAARSVADLGRP